MRVLCTCIPSLGRLHVVAPLARAIVEAGHELVVAAPASFLAHVNAAGLDAIVAGASISELRTVAERELPGAIGSPSRFAAHMFTHLAPQALRDSLLERAQDWGPDLILHEEGEYGGPLVAALLGVPNVTIGWPAPMRSADALGDLEKAMSSLWAASGLQPRMFGGVYRHLFLDCCPPSLQAPHASKVGRTWPMQPVPHQAQSRDFRPQWLGDLLPLPTVHATLGTVPMFNNARHIFEAIIRGLQNERVNLVVTVGDALDPKSFGRTSAQLQIERFIPHSVLLPSCDVVISHGGAGSVVSALFHGLPQIIVPRGGASQGRNALACARAGAALVLPESTLTPETVRDHVRAVLAAADFRAAAGRIANEIAHMPPPRAAVGVLEALIASAGNTQH